MYIKEPKSFLISKLKGKPIVLVVAAGPFTTIDHLLFEPLAELLAYFDIHRKLQDYTEYMGFVASVILVSSTRNSNNDFVFPQPAFDIL